MAWIESHQELARHPKTRKLARRLGVNLPTAIGHLHMFWWWAMDYSKSGDITSFDAIDIADAVVGMVMKKYSLNVSLNADLLIH